MTPILHLGASVLCSHAGTATATTPFARVSVSGQAVVTLATAYVVAGCSLTSIPSPPCVSGQFVTGAARVMAGGVPVATVAGSSTCTPTGNPLVPTTSQARVLAS